MRYWDKEGRASQYSQPARFEENGHVIWERGKYAPGDPGITNATAEDNFIAFDTGSGEYTFVLRGQ